MSDVPALAADARQLDDLHVSTIEELIAAELERGEGPALVAGLESLVADHPTRERLLGQLVLALYRSGRQADALAASPAQVARVTRARCNRWLNVFDDATIDDIALATSSLRALGSRHHSQALSTLRAMAEEATGRGRGCGVG